MKRSLQRTIPWLVAGIGGLLAYRPLSDFDTWWHLAAGRRIAQEGIPRADTFSHTAAGRDWIDLQWGFDLAVYTIEKMGGAGWLSLFAAVIIAGATAVAVANARGWRAPVTATFLFLVALVSTHERFTVRPEILTFLWLGLTIFVLQHARTRDGRGLWLLPLLTVVWVNTHALFILGWFVIACAVAAERLARWSRTPQGWREGSRWSDTAARKLWIAAGLSLPAGILNPYGFQGLLFPFELWTRIDSSQGAFAQIGEFERSFANWFPDPASTAYQLLFLAGVGVVLWAAHKGRRGEGFDLFGLFVFAGMAFLSTLAWRNVALFAFGAVPFVIQAAGNGVDGRQDSRSRPRLAWIALVAILAFVPAIVTHGFYRFVRQVEQFGGGVLASNTPLQMTEFAAGANLPPKLFNDMALGGYLNWKPVVDQGVYIDGRLEVYDRDIFQEYQDALGNIAAFQAVADRRDIGSAVLFHRWKSRHPLIRELIAAPRWALVYFDEVAVVFVRSDRYPEQVTQAVKSFPEWADRTSERLREPLPKGRLPLDRLVSVSAYADLLAAIGYGDRAVGWYEYALELGVAPAGEIAVRMALVEHFERKGDRTTAREHLERAIELDPRDERLAEKLRSLGAR